MTAKKNLILILTDQQRFDTMACYGNQFIQTPNLNRLADSSFVIENAYCSSPLCTPARASIMTGQWPHAHGCITNNTHLAPAHKTIAEMVDPSYRRAYFGKWHLGDEIIPQHGFEEWVSSEDGEYRPYYSNPAYLEKRSDYHHFLIRNGFVPDSVAKDGGAIFSRGFCAALSEQYTKVHFLGNRAVDFIRDQSAIKPFLLTVSFLEPHPPYWSPFNDRYDPDSIPAGGAWMQKPGPETPVRARMMDVKYEHEGWEGFPLRTEANWRRIKANYYGSISLVDRAIGRILDELDQSGLAENTMVVFTSDHGDMMGDHHILAKGLRYEESSKIPLLMRIPWLSQDTTRIGGNFSQVDLVPTLLDLLDETPAPRVQGNSQAMFLRQKQDLTGDVVVEWNGNERSTFWQNIPGFTPEDADVATRGQWRTIYTYDRWKMTLCQGDVQELFDLRSDPYEMNNLFDQPQYSGRVEDMKNRLENWQAQTKDNVSMQ